MDQKLRDLERLVAATPDDKELVDQLLTARRRSGIRPTDVTGVMLEFNDLREKAEQAKEQLIKDGKEIFKLYVSAVFAENPDLKAVVVQGWTPGFNDGDACTHSMDVMVSQDEFADNGYDEGEDEEDEGEEEEEAEDADEASKLEDDPDVSDDYEDDNISRLGYSNSKLSKKKAEEITKQFQSFDDILEDIHGTNWRLAIVRQKNGKPKIHKSHYDCGN
jgi:hypothetical protein